MDRVYRIAKWDEVFENSVSRKLKNLSWISFPIDLSSNGYMSMLETFKDEAPLIYGAWAALVCVAAKCPRRGTLAYNNGTPKTPERIAREVHFPVGVMQRMWDWAASQEVAWIELVPQRENLPEPREIPPSTRDDMTRHGIELNTDETEARPSVRPSGERIALSDSEWTDVAPLMQKIARIVSWNKSIRAKDLSNKDWRLCCVTAALADRVFGSDWIDSILESITDRSGPPENKWAHFRGALIETASRLGQDFHALERLVSLPARQAAAKQTESTPAAQNAIVGTA